jgi:uncharacterized protein YyaL (SSP411 family)
MKFKNIFLRTNRTNVKSLSTFLYVLILFSSTNCSRQSQENNQKANRLYKARSPYLQEHADNPVDWYEWSSEALEKANKENKPLIISIGYASCHWCHVMEKESFMDTAVARIMNENFISIKVDREERPDIDQIYLNAAQLISGNAGWPLNAFALPDGKPFYAATYFPKDQWIKVLLQVVDVYKKENRNVVKQAETLTKDIQSSDVALLQTDSLSLLNKKTYDETFTRWKSYFDNTSGGLVGATKFPMPAVWEFLLQNHYLTSNKDALQLVNTTLTSMAKSGIYDHLAGGFARYATDNQWKIPHFEKMLYDNGQLVSLYTHAYQVTHDPLYKKVIVETLQFVKKELTSEEGGFYSSLNADSEGEEGKFYVWTKSEIIKILNPNAANVFTEYYQVTDSGNWENGKNILRPTLEEDKFIVQDKFPNESEKILEEAGAALLQVRNKRVHPALDNKILVSWNALMLKGYIDAYAALNDPEYLDAALKNARFLEKNMLHDRGKLWRNYQDGKPGTDAFLDDYALLARSFIDLYQVTFDLHWLDQARKITDYALAHFFDQKTGLFYYTSDESETLVARKLEIFDSVIPSSNSVMAEVIYLLGTYYDLDTYTRTSANMVKQIDKEILSGPHYARWASLMGMITYGPYEVAIVGKDALARNREMMRYYSPTSLFMGGEHENLPLLENKYVHGRNMIYVCRNRVCKSPTDNVHSAVQQLNKSSY